ncbi:hypothetical protein CUMW_256560 [Citrus unshiu]|uniref:Uncharacterized protein n=1 Tax=Citrus unshiu TaxID=55188 RepID=A0A2H5QS63_CITUN|nr:hypothetical protein CUMW_256560 [Citrus unshiu]
MRSTRILFLCMYKNENVQAPKVNVRKQTAKTRNETKRNDARTPSEPIPTDWHTPLGNKLVEACKL